MQEHFYSKYVKKSHLKNKELRRRLKARNSKNLKKKQRKVKKNKQKSVLTHKQRRKKILGFNPMNAKFKRSEFHHLHFDIYGNEDKNIGIYIPRKIHRTIIHNGATYSGLRELIDLIIFWYPERKQETYCNIILLLLIKIRTPYIKEKI